MAVKHGPRLLTEKKRKDQDFRTKCLRKLLRISYLERRTKTEYGARSTSLWVQRNFFWQLSSYGNLQGSDMLLLLSSLCHTPRQPLQKHPSRHVGGWATPWSAEEMLDGQHQRVDIPVHDRTANNGLLQKRLKEDLC